MLSCVSVPVIMCVSQIVNWEQQLYSGPVMTKFTIALREIGTYKEVLRSQVNVAAFKRVSQLFAV